MHVPDGFFDLPTSAATGVVAAGVLSVAVRRSGTELREAGAPLAGLTAVFVFAAQMINFPVGAGTSGHLLGGTLAAVLVGPWTGMLAMTVVLGVQALFFADGGLTALGTNIVLMAVIPVAVGYGLSSSLVRVAPSQRGLSRPGFLAGAAGVGALVSVPSSALAFSALYGLGGTVAIPMGQLVTAMLAWHLAIGVGEALITAAVVSAVLATRQDLVFLARRHARDVVLIDAAGNPIPARNPSPEGQPVAAPSKRWWAVAAAVPVLIAGVLALTASSQPDGLAYVAQTLGFAGAERASATAGSALSGYDVRGWSSAWATGAAGVLGLALVAVISYLSLALISSRRAPTP